MKTANCLIIILGFNIGLSVAWAEPEQSRAALEAQARTALQQGNPRQAVRSLQRLHQRGPLSTDHRLLLAESYLRLNRLDPARQAAHTLLETDPDHSGARRLLGDIAARQRDWPTAQRHYAHAVMQQPDDPTLQLRLGQAHQALGDEISAEQAFARYRALTDSHRSQ